MINIPKLRGVIAENGYSQRALAEELGMTPKTFYNKMERGVFDTDEVMQLITLLHIDHPMDIFFVTNVT